MKGTNRTGQTWAHAARVKWGISIVALLVLMAFTAGSSSAMRFVNSSPRHFTATPVITAKQHEGQKSDLSYTSGNITTYKEGDTINFRFTLSGSEASSGQVQVRFTENDGDCLFFSNYFVLGTTTNVSGATPTVGVASGPAPPDSGEWVVTLDVSFSGTGEGVVNYQLKLSNEAGDCNGSSQHSRLTPGDGVSQTGQQNVPVPANQIIELPNITVAKLVDRADGAGFVPAGAGEYCFSLDGGTCTAIDSSGQVVFANATDGDHTITESANLAHSGYTFDSGEGTNCVFTGSTATATVAQGTTATNATCTFKNKLTAPPKVTVTKSCSPGPADADDRFQVQLNGSNAGAALACSGTLDVAPTPGQAYSITEVAGNGTTNLADYTSSPSSGCSGTLNFGGTATCTITNTLKALPTVTVTKDCDPNAGADADDRFQFTNNGNNVPADPVACEGSRTITLQPGAGFNFDEVAGNGTTTLADYTKTRSSGCTDNDGLQRGETGNCTITNTLKALPTVTVTKNCAPDAGADADDRFQITNNGNNTNDSPLACEGSVVLTLERGAAFDINEVAGNGTTDLGNYTETRSAGCTDADGLQRGETGACTITNTLKAAPTVTVNKVCEVKAAAGDRFQVKLDGTDTGAPLDCGDSLDVAVTAGADYAITEGAAGTTDLANYTSSLSDDCSGKLANFGDTATCTITNTLKAAPKVTVTKTCPNGKANAGDRFQVKRNGTNVGAALDCGPQTTDSTDVTVTAGVAYTITEGAAGTADLANYTTTFGEGCSGTLAHFGDTASCTITNTLKAAPKLTVIKHVVNDNGGTKSAGDFTLTVTGSSPSPASFAGSEAGTTVTLQPGPYAVNEAAVSGYTTTKAASCAGSLIHFGDTATCTVTNDDVAAPPPPPPPVGAPEIDLAITKADSPDPVSVGALLTYTLTVTNKKGDTANNVVVTDSLPSAVTFVSVSSTKGSCSGTNPIICNIGTVAFNELVSIMIVVRPTNPGTITNTAVVTGREHEHDPADNTATATTLVQGAFVPPSVCYALTVTPRTLTVGRRTVVNVLVREAGKPVKGVRVVITGRGLTKRANTNANGRARFLIIGRSPGILQIRVPSHATCRRQRIGVLGVFTPPVTG